MRVDRGNHICKFPRLWLLERLLLPYQLDLFDNLQGAFQVGGSDQGPFGAQFADNGSHPDAAP